MHGGIVNMEVTMVHSNLSCSFCGKREEDVEKLIAGPTVYICNECVGFCNDIIAEEEADADARGTGRDIAAQPEDTLNVLAFVHQHCDGRPMDSVTVGELVTKRRMLSEAYSAGIGRRHQERREREERERVAAREEQARRGFEYVDLDTICADAEGPKRIRAALQQLNVDRQWCMQHHALPFTFGDQAAGYTVASPQPAPGDQYEAVFHARIRAGFVLGAARFKIQYCDPDAFDRTIARIFDDESNADADDRLRDALQKIPSDAIEREIGELGKPHQR